MTKHSSKRTAIIEMMQNGMSLGEVAKQLGMGKGNVAWYWNRHKQGVRTRKELEEENKNLRAERDVALKGYKEMRDFIRDIPCDCEIECRTCETGRNLLTSFPEIK